MKSRKAEIVRRVHAAPEVRFESHGMSSFGGLVVFDALFRALGLAERLRGCFKHLGSAPVYGIARVTIQLVVHVLLGFRRLRDRDYYSTDPLVCRLVGVSKLPDVSTITRTLAAADARAAENLREMSRALVVERLAEEKLARVTMDFDGSVITTKGHAEGSAVGYNPKRKGARSYYPLFCVVSQVGQFLDVHHRPGNTHDSNGASDFIARCAEAVRTAMPRVTLESRLDSAFYDEDVVQKLQLLAIEFAIAVPFHRLPALKRTVEMRERWRTIDEQWAYFELQWAPRTWDRPLRLIVVRQKRKLAHRGPLQLDIFEPINHEYEYKVIATSKTASASSVIAFFHGRGNHEARFAEAKQFAALDYIPCRRLVANKIWTYTSLLAHNLSRELQMRTNERARTTSPTRSALWDFCLLGTIRNLMIRRAARITRPANKLTVTIAADGRAQHEIARSLEMLRAA